ncbi:hypothetical protein GCM10020001_002140 [Nonomuraea salmonea]
MRTQLASGPSIETRNSPPPWRATATGTDVTAPLRRPATFSTAAWRGDNHPAPYARASSLFTSRMNALGRPPRYIARLSAPAARARRAPVIAPFSTRRPRRPPGTHGSTSSQPSSGARPTSPEVSLMVSAATAMRIALTSSPPASQGAHRLPARTAQTVPSQPASPRRPTALRMIRYALTAASISPGA